MVPDCRIIKVRYDEIQELNMTLYEDLKWRGLIQDISDPKLVDKLNAGGLSFYIGTDPTADSLHLGH